LTNRNRIRGRSGRTSELKVTKFISVKGQGCKSDECAMKADGLSPGGLRRVSESGLRGLRGFLTAVQRSAEGIVALVIPDEEG
jgi:hypothetical protein